MAQKVSKQRFEHRIWWEGDDDLQDALRDLSQEGWAVIAAWPTGEDLGDKAYVVTGVRMILQRPYTGKADEHE